MQDFVLALKAERADKVLEWKVDSLTAKLLPGESAGGPEEESAE